MVHGAPDSIELHCVSGQGDRASGQRERGARGNVKMIRLMPLRLFAASVIFTSSRRKTVVRCAQTTVHSVGRLASLSDAAGHGNWT
jgi:hypothetical protein